MNSSHSGLPISGYSSSLTRITDKESVIAELAETANTNEYLDWKHQVMGQLSLYPHFQESVLTSPRSKVRFLSGGPKEHDTLYSMLWLRLWKAVHKLQKIIPDLTIIRQPDIHTLWKTINEHYLPSTMERL